MKSSQDLERFKILLLQYQQNKLSKEEIVELQEFFEMFENEKFSEHLSQEFSAFWTQEAEDKASSFIKSADHTWPELEQKVWQKINQRPNKKISSYRWLGRVAAVFLMVSVLSLAVYWLYTAKDYRSDTVLSRSENDVSGGQQQGFLTLADGKRIDLRASENGILVQNGKVIYSGSQELIADAKHGHLELTIPAGGFYELTLSDGTKVWLNGASSLRYPSSFESDERIVTLEGEGYFEVTKRQFQGRSQTFKVRTQGQVLEVLGTEFNVEAYNQRPVTTTLVAGKVRVFNSIRSTSQTLIPGEQSIVKDDRISKHEVDTYPYISWRQGLLVFTNKNMQNILDQLTAWYPVEFDIQTTLNTHDLFTGEFDRNVPLSTVLNQLEDLSGIRFTIKERRVLVQR